jgi:dihydroorotate dehydrogenase (NAD+) catalytic subunit
MSAPDMTIPLGGLTLKNPVLTASGTFGYGLEYDDFFDVAELGGICSKGLSLKPRAGNPPERICETAAGMLNAIGLANVGVEAFCTEKLPVLRRRGVTVIANIFATSIDDFVELARRIDAEPGVAAIELNVSCPNVDKGGLEFGCDPRAAAKVTAAVREVTKLPIWVKMSPEAGDPKGVGLACQEAGADALTAIGLSGPALKPIALRIVWELSRAVTIPIIGIGGIATADDALEFLLAGASAVQVGTANFADPLASKKVLSDLTRYCAERNLRARDLIRAMR